jgi:hypothetical protein
VTESRGQDQGAAVVGVDWINRHSVLLDAPRQVAGRLLSLR